MANDAFHDINIVWNDGFDALLNQIVNDPKSARHLLICRRRSEGKADKGMQRSARRMSRIP